MMTRTISTACCRLTALASSRGAVPNTSPATAGLPRSGCFTQSTNAATPAWATRPSQDRFSADMARNQGRRRSIEAIAPVPRALIDCSRRVMVSALTRPGAGPARAPGLSALTGLACHLLHGLGREDQPVSGARRRAQRVAGHRDAAGLGQRAERGERALVDVL